MKMVRKLVLAAIIAGGVGVLSAAAQDMETVGENDLIVRCWKYCNDLYDGVPRQRCVVKCEDNGGPPAK